MTFKPVRLGAILTGILLLVGLVPAVSASAAENDARAEHQRIVDFWSKDKVAQAKPRHFLRNPSTGEFTLAAEESAPVLGAPWTQDDAVKRTTGKVLFTVGKTPYVCSASVATDAATDRSIVLTAAHCVFDNRTGRFVTNWMFVPDYDSSAVDLTTNGSFCALTQYGCWTASALVVHRGFSSQRRFTTQATLYDYAFAAVGDGGKTTLAQLDSTVGSQAVTYAPTATDSDTHLFGYPAASPYSGKDLIYSRGPLGTDPLNSDRTYRVASTMTGGASGGPWFSSFSGGAGTMMSVNSYGYKGVEAMHGPMFTTDTQKLFTTATTARANTIVR